MKRRICILIISLSTIFIIISSIKIYKISNMEDTDEWLEISTPPSTEFKLENQEEIKYKIVDGEYTNKEKTITFPQIVELGDDNLQNKINKILKEEALSVLGLYEEGNDVSLDITYKISLQSKSILSVQYSGDANEKDAPYPLRLFYTVSINVNKGSKVTLKQLVRIDNNFVNSIKNFKVKNPETNQASVSAFDYILNTYTEKNLIRYLEGADSSYQNSAFTFSYITKDAIGISIEVPHAVGDHLEIELKFQDIKENIKKENKLWNNLLH